MVDDHRTTEAGHLASGRAVGDGHHRRAAREGISGECRHRYQARPDARRDGRGRHTPLLILLGVVSFVLLILRARTSPTLFSLAARHRGSAKWRFVPRSARPARGCCGSSSPKVSSSPSPVASLAWAWPTGPTSFDGSHRRNSRACLPWPSTARARVCRDRRGSHQPALRNGFPRFRVAPPVGARISRRVAAAALRDCVAGAAVGSGGHRAGDRARAAGRGGAVDSELHGSQQSESWIRQTRADAAHSTAAGQISRSLHG